MFLLRSTILVILLTFFANARSIEDIQADGKIIIAVYENFPPYSFVKNGKLTGIDVDLGLMLAKSLKVKAEFLQTATDENLDADLRNMIWRGNRVHRNKADVMFRVPYDYDFMRETDRQTGELRAERVSIKGPYQSEQWIIATHKEKIPVIRTLAIFREHKIGTEIDTLPDNHLLSFGRGILINNVKHYFHYKDAIKDFKAGKLDAIAGQKAELEYLLDYKHNKAKYYLSDGIPMMKSKWDLATAVDSRFKALSYHIDGLISEAYQSGKIKKIFEKYGVSYLPPISKTQ